MGLEMKVYKETANYEPKPMFGRTWRQLAALAFMLCVGGGVFGGLAIAVLALGWSYDTATSVAMYAMFPVLIPAAAWGWWRPMGLKPERYLGYFLRYHLTRKSISYDDTLNPPARRAGEPVSGDSHQSAEQKRARKRSATNTRKLKKTVTEHS